jgi:hypothetical protein
VLDSLNSIVSTSGSPHSSPFTGSVAVVVMVGVFITVAMVLDSLDSPLAQVFSPAHLQLL